MVLPVSSTIGFLRTNEPVARYSGVTGWFDGIHPDISSEAARTLEAGQVVVLPNLGFPVLPAEQFLLSDDLLSGSRKNIAFDPATGRIGGAERHTSALASLLGRFSEAGDTLMRGLLTSYASALSRGRASFRPAEIEGRVYSPRHDDRLLHIDAFPSRPVHGDRILRLFTNISPTGRPRRWRAGGSFEDLAQRFVPTMRLPPPFQGRLYALLGLTKSVPTPYDQLMLRLHDRMKLDAAYQRDAPAAYREFAPGSTWLCFTDQVAHAALAGHMALEQTFYLPVAAMAEPKRSPLRVLERLTGRDLA